MDQINKIDEVKNSFKDGLAQSLLIFKIAKKELSNQNKVEHKEIHLSERDKTLYTQIQNEMSKVMVSVKNSRSPNGGIVKDIVNELSGLVTNDKNIILKLNKIRNADEYTFLHSINTTVLALAIGGNLGLEKEDLIKLGMGTILHDIGKCNIPKAILNKPEKLTNEEYEVIKTHTKMGYEILINSNKFDKSIANVALNHHERWNGKGYPNGIASQEIDLFSRICTIADIYDAISSERVYKHEKPSYEAAQFLMENSSIMVDPSIMNMFADSIDIYRGSCREVAFSITDKILREIYLCLSHKYKSKCYETEIHDKLVDNRLKTLFGIINISEKEAKIFLNNFSIAKKDIQNNIFNKVYGTLRMSDSQLEKTHWKKPVFKCGDIVKINKSETNIEKRYYFVDTVINDYGIFGKVTSCISHDYHLPYKNKIIRISELRRLNPEF